MCGVDPTVDEGRLLGEWNPVSVFTFFNARSSNAAPYDTTTVFEAASLSPDGQLVSSATTVNKDGLHCLFVVPPMTECDSSALDAVSKGNNGFYPVFLGISNNFSLPVEAFVAGAKCLQLEYGGHFPKLCGLTSSMVTTTATSRNEGFQGIYNFPVQ